MILENNMNDFLTKYSTPFYILNIDDMLSFIEKLDTKLNNKISVCYAMKANPLLVGFISDFVDKIEVCSIGEFEICKRNNVPLKKIVLSGVYKNYDDMENIFLMESSNEITYTIESNIQMEYIIKLCEIYKKQISVLLRYSSGNQFGMDESTIYNIVQNNMSNPLIKIKGMQYYSGTQKKQISYIQDEFNKIINFMKYIETSFDITFSEIEFGPGVYFEYFDDAKENNNYLDIIIKNLPSTNYCVTLEIGRYLVAPFGDYICKIVDIKTTNNINYAIVDGGINHINYYGQIMGLRNPMVTIINKNGISNDYINSFVICGSLCTSSDTLIKKLDTYSLNINDFIIFHNVGAYSITESLFLFLSHDMPKVILKIKGNFYVGRDIIKTHLINSILDLPI